MCQNFGTRATNTVSALMSGSGTLPGGCLIEINRSSGHPWKYAFVMSPDLTVRRSHEAHERRMFKPSMSQVGESVLTPVVSSRSPRLTNRLQRCDMKTTFAPFVLVFVDFDPLEWDWLVSLDQQFFQFGSRYGYTALNCFHLAHSALRDSVKPACVNWSEASKRMFLELLPPVFGRYLWPTPRSV